jgi:hypothetical protein
MRGTSFFIKTSSMQSDIVPAGSEYASENIFPPNKLPNRHLTIKIMKASTQPNVNTAISDTTLLIPIFAPGANENRGGNAFSNTCSTRATAV